MRTAGHKIADAVFNFNFASADETVRGAAVLPGLIKAQLVPCMDDIFDRWGPDQDVVRIDHLAVNLGNVAYDDMARVLARRLEHALNAALGDRTPADQASGVHAVRRIPPHQAGLDLITHYLRTGTVPWTAEKSSPAELNRILGSLIDQTPLTLLAFLQSQNQKVNPVLSRLTRQFNPDQLLRLAARLAPSVAPSLGRLVDVLAALHRAAALAPVTDRELMGALWDGILRQLLLPGGRSISPHTLVANALYTTAARHPISRSRLSHHLTRERRTAAGIEMEKLVTAVMRHLGPVGTEHEDPWAPLASKLFDALFGRNTDGFARAWPVMVTRFAEPTRQVIRQTARQAQVRRTIARRFTPRQFGQLVVLLEPRHAHFVNNVLEHQKTLGRAMHRTSATAQTMGVHLREFTLAYLLSKGATRFNRRQFCAGMIRRLAGRHNMAYEALLEDFHTFFSSAVAADDDTGRALKEILDEIRGHCIDTQIPLPAQSRELPAPMRNSRQHEQASANSPAAPGRDAGVMLMESAQHRSVPAAARRQGLDSEETKVSITFDGPVTVEIRAVLSGLTAALERLAARHPRRYRLLTHALLEMGRDVDPSVLVQHLARRFNAADGATSPGALYQELCRGLTALGPLPPSPGGPSGLSETECCKSPWEIRSMMVDRPVPGDIRAVLGRYTRPPGPTAALERLAARHLRWSRRLSLAQLEVIRELDPAALIKHLIRRLQKADGVPTSGVLYQELRRELTILRPLSRAADGPPAQMAGGDRSEREASASVISQDQWIWREPEGAAAPDPSVFVQNAGLVLAAPYLPRFFGMLGLTEKNRFNHHAAAERAVHLLEFIVNERRSAPEFQLALNKILCGVAASTPIVPGIDITPKERSAVDSLIRSIIEHWKILGNTSPEGLRTTFLQREGYLTLKDDAWSLRVEERSFDMLLDRLPWSYAVIKHPWMTRMLYVKWRSL